MASKLLFNDVVCIVCDVVLCVTPFDVSEMVFFCEECADEVPDPILVPGESNA